MEYHRALMMTQVNHLDSKLKRSSQIQEKIKIIENNPAYLSKKDIDTELKKTEDQISEALKIASQINEIKLQPNYLDRDQVQILQEQVPIHIEYGYLFYIHAALDICHNTKTYNIHVWLKNVIFSQILVPNFTKKSQIS